MALPTISTLATSLANAFGALINATVYSSYTLITAGTVTTGATVYFYSDPGRASSIGHVDVLAGSAFAAPGPDLAAGLPMLVLVAAFGVYRVFRRSRVCA